MNARRSPRNISPGDKPFERLLIRPPAFWDERHVTMLLGQRVIARSIRRRTAVTLGDGETIGYGTLIWAARRQRRGG